MTAKRPCVTRPTAQATALVRMTPLVRAKWDGLGLAATPRRALVALARTKACSAQDTASAMMVRRNVIARKAGVDKTAVRSRRLTFPKDAPAWMLKIR